MSAAPPSMSVDEMIRHYQRSIERSQNDPNRILHCLNKLRRMDVTVTHLQSTGIGRTVNFLRKDHGDVGSLAKSLITKWKQMVASESSDHSEENRSENDQSSQEQEEMVDLTHKSLQNHKHSSSKHKRGGHRDNSKHHSQNSHHRERKKVAEENGEKSTKRKRRSSHDSDRNSHKTSSHHKVEQHRKNENNHDEHDDNKHHKRSNETDSVSSTSSSHKKHRENEQEHSSSSKRIKCDSTTSPSSQRNKEKKSSKSKAKPIDDGIEIDHSTGTSFADALGMIEPLPKTKSSLSSSSVNSHKSSESKNSSLLTSSSSLSSSHEKKERLKEKSKPSTSSSNKSNTPTLLTTKAKLPPLDDLLKDLPPPVECVIRNDYKPLPVNALFMDCLYRPNNSKLSSANEAAALCASTTSKNQRTKVYSGTKTGQLLSVPSLHELCIRFLQKNIDALEYTGGVPFEILRPVLERASPNQLFTFEHFNPYLMEDSDVLWQQHCKNKFRAYKRQEMETWREMYTRCEKEQEERLASLANNIKKSISVAIPVRQTKLAYVDTAVKPPRGIVKKQNQFGTHAKLVATPAARVDALSSVATNIARVGDARLRTSAAIRDTAQAQPSNGALKPKKAPLMMKTLQLMKGRFKR